MTTSSILPPGLAAGETASGARMTLKLGAISAAKT